MSKLLCIAGGGTGGHVMPALALADAVRSQMSEVNVNFIGAKRGLEATLLPERGEDVLLLDMHAVQGAGFMQRVKVLLWELPQSVMQIRKAWKISRPDVLVGVGGYASVAGVVAALLSRIPVVLYEQNAIPGLVNRMLYRFCARMMLGFSSAEKHLQYRSRQSVVTGNVIRDDILKVVYTTHEKPCLLIVGGSQGAMFLNDTVPCACQNLARQGKDFRVIHLVGAGDGRVQAVKAMYDKVNIEADVQVFSHDMPSLLAQASLMVARAGAMTVCEAGAVGMPALFVPLPWAADNHQYFNALSMKEVGAADIVRQKTCDVAKLTHKLSHLLFNPVALQAMSHAGIHQTIRDAGKRQVGVLEPLLEASP
ncbi:MAG: undecaprenyldiphospho-muramoylpentapeptide beta-N-acetylglucosaminyltransferase [Ghiorsea sp.]|nr:undecaprenyldiphospho-muramoylpentapeptide beta-N-acetylglucosaminyltransferase [Ghiorsea sp.]